MATSRSTRLGVETLDERIVPAVLNLTRPGAEVVASQFIVRQSAAGDPADFTKFVQLQDRGTEEGYNTTARRTQFDEQRPASVQSALRLGDVPVVTVGGVAYREFVLDVNQHRFLPFISLDQVKIFTGSSSNFSNYRSGRMDGQRPVFDMDAKRDVSVVLNANLNANLNRGRGYGDMTLLVRDSAFAGVRATDFVSLYSKFGGLCGGWATGGAESWSVRDGVPQPPPPPPPPTGTSSLSGRVFVDAFMNGIFDPEEEGDVPLAGVNLTLLKLDPALGYVSTGLVVTTAEDGSFSFTGLTAGTYLIRQEEPTEANGFPLVDGDDYVGSLGGTLGTDPDRIFNIDVGDNQHGTGYYFTELYA